MASPARYLFRKLRIVWIALLAFGGGAFTAAVSPTVYDVASDIAAPFMGQETNRTRAARLLTEASTARETAVLKVTDLEATRDRLTAELATAQETIADRDAEIADLGLTIVDDEQARETITAGIDAAIASQEQTVLLFQQVCDLAAEVDGVAALCATPPTP